MTVDRRKYLSPDEVESLRTQARHGPPIAWLLVDMALQTGLRVSELARLTIGDLDLRRGAIQVCRSKKRWPKGDPRRGTPRLEPEWLPVAPSLVEHLRQHLASLGTLSPDASIWGGVCVKTLARWWKQACLDAGLSPDAHIHQARHTLAVRLLKSAPNPSQALRLVQKQLGHESPETTAKLYADVPWEDRADALAALFG